MNSLRYRTARDTQDLLGQVFTPPAIADLLMDSITSHGDFASQVLDLGAGEGSLTESALKKLPQAESLLVEIDSVLAASTRKKLKRRNVKAQVICGSVFDEDFLGSKTPNLILTNPPYVSTPITSAIEKTLFTSNLDIPTSGGWVRGDAAFIAKAWSISRIGCGLGLIIASPIIRDFRFKKMRETLISQLSGLCVIQLDSRTFSNAEVQAFIVTGSRAINRRRKIILKKALVDGTITDEIEITHAEGIQSLDIDYHQALLRMGLSAKNSHETLESIGTKLTRGSKSLKDFERLGLKAFHTTDFQKNLNEISLRGAHKAYKLAGQGDILLPRVGSRCLIKQVKVKAGKGIFTDCVYRLTLDPNLIPAAWRTLTSQFGAEWRLAHASGSCARHLTSQAILTMPLIS